MANRPNPKDEEKKNPANPEESKGGSSSGGTPPPAGSAGSSTSASPALARALLLGGPVALGTAYKHNVPYVKGNTISSPHLMRAYDEDPGIMSIGYLPTYGYSDSAHSALNRAAFHEFNTIRREIQGNRSYEPADHYIYRMCVDSLRELYYMIARAYGTVRLYKAGNVYMPRALLAAQGLKPDDWINNSNIVHAWLINNAAALEPFPTTKIGNITDRHLAYASAIYTDADHGMSQMYVMRPEAFYSYELVDEVKGISLKRVPDNATVTQVINLWNQMYTALQGSSDVYRIAADIRTAFKDSVYTDLPAIPIDYVVPVIYDPDALTFIHNLNTIGIGCYGDGNDTIDAMLSTFRLRDQNGLLYCTPGGHVNQWDHTNYHFSCTPQINYLSFASANPTDLEKLAALRSVFVSDVGYKSESTEGSVPFEAPYFKSFGTEIYTRFTVYSYTGTSLDWEQMSSVMISTNTGDAYRELTMKMLNLVSCFDFHPMVYTAQVLSAQNVFNQNFVMYRFGDTQVVFPITQEEIRTFHDAYLLASFGVQ